MKILNNTLKPLLSFFIAIFIISFAIAFVILFRPYYYWNIKILELDEETNYTVEEIKEAYDDVMDFLVFGDEFKTENYHIQMMVKLILKIAKNCLLSISFVYLYHHYIL